MANVDLTFKNVDDASEMDAVIDDNSNSEMVIQALIDAGFLQPIPDPTSNSQLSIKGRNTITAGQTLASAGVRPHDQIRVEVAQSGGGNAR